MKKKNSPPETPKNLRRKAERTIRKMPVQSPRAIEGILPPEMQRLVHELQVHQIELELQNEELRRSQIELDAMQARYFELFDLAPVGYITVSEPGLILETNLTAMNLLGVTRGELIKQALTRFIFSEDQDSYYRHRKKLIETGAPQVCELRMRKKGGGVFWTHLQATAAQTITGDSICRIVLSDITDRKRLEEDKEAIFQSLLSKNQELERFTYSVSHNLKSPLVTIQTFLGLLEKDMKKQDREQMAKDMEFIRTAADRMSRLLGELLRLSQVGRMGNPATETSVQSIVADAMNLVAGRISTRGVKIRITSGEILLRGDRERFVEIFQNLVDNACKFMGEQADPRIEIGAETISGETVLFVRDNGIGVAPQSLPLLFDLFHRLNPDSQGEGIGLTLVKRIVELHGGRIWVESDGLGFGTTFRFTLGKNIRTAIPANEEVLS